MLQVSNLSKSYGDNLLFEKVSFSVNPGERLGLIGPNGCGKTTLFKVILGELKPDSGSARLSPGDLRIGYLAQALEYQPGQTVTEVIKAAIDGLTSAEQRLAEISSRMATATGDELERLLRAYGRTQVEFERLGGYGVEARADGVLAGLGLDELALDTKVELLSGGQKTRLGLARLLISAPQLLLLDEPTNHLDIEALEWLEQYLSAFDGAAVIVSHDRAFLDRTVDAILEIDTLTHTVNEYPGNYSDYIASKERERRKHWAAYKDQQDWIERLKGNLAERKNYARSIELGTIDFGPRKIAKGIARKAQVQQRRIERLLESEERIDRPGRTWQMKLEFENTPPSGRDVLRLESVSMGFGDRLLFAEVNATLRAGERIALIGANGSGKTTLARLILGELEPLSGEVRLGTGVRLGYFAQEQEDIDPDSTPLNTIRSMAAMSETEARSFLHYFLFSGEQVFGSVRSLSHGERARLILARLVAQGSNFLLLDEPINHLDIPARSSFEQAMTAFDGTVLAIVHDRYFIENFATGVWSLEKGGIGTYLDLDDARRNRQAKHNRQTASD
jgi:ATP-binding cassette subfamily F protein 3